MQATVKRSGDRVMACREGRESRAVPGISVRELSSNHRCLRERTPLKAPAGTSDNSREPSSCPIFAIAAATARYCSRDNTSLNRQRHTGHPSPLISVGC
ncbi:hypothetical protein EYF80_007447 [Liparis tanakae]|uniref:Uncharacterized protein n=1 Tax=Liparis tanakae TaxID=230148 RepID=A0A4Z2IWS4_9TELE|nr:hypothetical protein EYF80_007447 [Liparis tanakae]